VTGPQEVLVRVPGFEIQCIAVAFA